MGGYQLELKRAMSYLAMNEKVVFLGQAVEFPGTAMTTTLEGIDKEKLIELPVEEDLQMGIATGMALSGMIPVSIFPRWNFMLLAVNQIVNHLDKMESMSDGACTPKVIIRVAKGSEKPVDPQDQHKGNFADAFKLMCTNIDIIELDTPESILEGYQFAYNNSRSTILVEFPDYGK
jgi:pyruvate/2-oxoglutarate/acetoin dehydrogenase E1 component